MNTRGRKATIAAAGLAIIIGAPLVFKGGQWQRQHAREVSCISNLKQIGLGTMQYTRDYDEVMPRAANWSEALFPYTRSVVLFQCPQRGQAAQGYAFYHDAQEAYQEAFNEPDKMVMYFDSNGLKLNTADTGASLPRPPRHPHGNALCYADGHVKVVAQPDLKYGYDADFMQRNREARAASARFWVEYQKKQAHSKRLRLKQIAARKKAKKP
ncbi:MAG TPA: DUF1559 domain-containing protein [Abditibacteriaceae bacterium]|jgi:prepilin-type processing-associated H-X9-DG protein